MSKYKVGDKVRVRSDLVVDKKYGADTFISPMAQLKGKIVEITTEGFGKYGIKESIFNWTDEMFEPVYKFNVGDRVVIKLDHNSVIGKDKYKGITAKIIRVEGDACEYRYILDCEKMYKYRESELELNCQKIVITVDGRTTTASLYENDKVVKSAQAKCNPEDEFDFNIGARLAFDRLIGEKTEVKEEPSIDGFKVGDRVNWKGHNGTVICLDDNDIGVQFDKAFGNHYFHTCGGAGTEPTCRWFISKELKHGEVEEFYNGKVVCVKKFFGSKLEVGKIYTITDGQCEIDGFKFFVKPVKDFDEIKSRLSPMAEFLEIKE